MKTKLLVIAIAAASSASLSFARPGSDGPRGERPNPDDIVVELIADYAGDDNELDAAELAVGLTAMHEKRAGKMKQGRQDIEQEGENRRPDPSEIAANLIENFDANGSQTLDAAEMLEALESMGPRRRDGKGRRGANNDTEDTIE